MLELVSSSSLVSPVYLNEHINLTPYAISEYTRFVIPFLIDDKRGSGIIKYISAGWSSGSSSGS